MHRGAAVKDDALSKVGLEALLEPFVQVSVQHEVQPPAQYVDLYVTSPPAEPEAMARALGLLGRIAAAPCLLEPFGGTISAEEAESCVRKQLTLRHALALRGEQDPRLPLWLLSVGRPASVLSGFGLRAAEGWPAGVYRGPAAMDLWVVVLRELPAGADTLALRVLGDRELRESVARELAALPRESPARDALDRMLYRWRRWLLGRPEDEMDRVEMARFRELVRAHEESLREEGRAEGKAEGKAEGRLTGRAEALLRVLAARGLALSEAQRARVEQERDLGRLDRWLERALSAADAGQLFADDA